VEGEGLETRVDIRAIDAHRNLCGQLDIDLFDQDASEETTLVLSSKTPRWHSGLQEQAKIHLSEETREKNDALRVKFASGLPGNPVPEMEAGTWLNTDATSLDWFRGRFVLLDFWFIGCGPCHRDMPEIRAIHEAFPTDKFAIVSMHLNSMKPDNVQGFADQSDMSFAIVVDDVQGQISDAYEALGVDSYPSYLLIAPDGNIVLNTSLPGAASFRKNKMEMIHDAIQSWDWDRDLKSNE
jgi:thiol-disulfide isomerase/thioredoxin